MKQLYFVVLQLYLFKEWFFETVLEITFTRYVYLPSSEKMLLFSKTNGCVRVFQMKYLTIYILKLLFTMKLHLNFFWLREKAILRFVQRASCQGMAKKVEILQEDQDNTRPWKTTHVNLMKPAKWKKSRTYSL